MKRLLLLNGPNLDMLGTREPDVYGSDTLEGLEEMVALFAAERGVTVTCFQSNSESKLIERIHGVPGRFDGVVYNPGAHTHYSYALRDAVASILQPVVEVHISAIETREAFRHVSVIAPVCVAQVKGLGFGGYCRAVEILCENEDLPRLGEGYEARYPADAHIIVAGHGELPAGETGAGVAADTAMDAPAMADVAGDDEDFAEPYAEDVAAADAGMLAFERLGRVRAACDQLGVDAFLVRDTPSIQWLTALDGVFDEERAHALLVTPTHAALHTDSRYSNAVRAKLGASGAGVDVSDERQSHVAFAVEGLGEAFDGRLGFEDDVTYAEFAKLSAAFGAGRLAATSDVVRGLRAIKTRSELSRLLAAQAVTDAAFEHIVGFMRPGMTERQVQLELEDFMLRHGGEGLAFRSIVACGANGADPHAVPGDALLEAGQCVVMDFGARAFGYCADMTRTVFLGSPDERMQRAWDVLRQANEQVEAMIQPGVTGREAHELAERVLAEGGFGGRMGHGLGHGVGLEVHELPVLNTRNDKPLVAGNVVTVEPGIYLPGEFGMRLEDCGVVTGSGYEPFSQLGHEMVII